LFFRIIYFEKANEKRQKFQDFQLFSFSGFSGIWDLGFGIWDLGFGTRNVLLENIYLSKSISLFCVFIIKNKKMKYNFG
jgi:hypothetical protein